jgi:hypothetical protein
MARWSKEVAFPVVNCLIDKLCKKFGSADRDQIALALLEEEDGQRLLESVLANSQLSPFREACYVVDWFSAELTNASEVSFPYKNLYRRDKTKRKHPETGKRHEVYVYYLSQQVRRAEALPEEVDADESFVEGATKSIKVNAYERNLKAREKCINYYGCACFVCGFDFHSYYGSVGIGYIQVHHLKPLSEIGEAYEVDPITDLRPVCANCHAIIHRRNPPYAIEEVKDFISQSSNLYQ